MEKKNNHRYFVCRTLTNCRENAKEEIIGFSKKIEALRAIDSVRKSRIEYEDIVQDVSTDFLEKDGKCIVSVTTHRGNYADSYEEFCMTDANGNPINITWADVDAAEIKEVYYEEYH